MSAKRKHPDDHGETFENHDHDHKSSSHYHKKGSIDDDDRGSLSEKRKWPHIVRNSQNRLGYPIPTKSKPYLPKLYNIYRGSVARIETFGAFVQLRDVRAQGLVHKSQLANIVVNEVSDAVDIDQNVWVKVLEVSEEDHPTIEGKKRHRIRLSMKHASQDDGTDLDPTNEGAAADVGRSHDRSSASNIEKANLSSYSRQPNHLEKELNSNIGIAIAIDPLSMMNQGKGLAAGGGLILKGDCSRKHSSTTEEKSAGKMLFNGYALVDDDEGEMPSPLQTNNRQRGAVATASTLSTTRIKAQGRGRGTTLPAWMTQSKNNAHQRESKSSGTAEVKENRSKCFDSSIYNKRNKGGKQNFEPLVKHNRDGSAQSSIDQKSSFSSSSSSSSSSSTSSSYRRRRRRAGKKRSKKKESEKSKPHRHKRERKIKSKRKRSHNGKDERKIHSQSKKYHRND